MSNFDGSLTNEQINYLRSHGLSDKKINKIESLLKKHKEGLTDYVDLVGDDLMPGPFFFNNLEHYGYLLDLGADKASSLEHMKLRAKVVIPVIQKLGKYFLKSDQIFEDRNELLAFAKRKTELENKGIYTMDETPLEYEKDPGIELPKEPAIWTMNHRFKDDVLASVRSVSRPFSLFAGSVPQFFNTFDGLIAYYFGCILLNRKSKDSKLAGQEKGKKAMEMGLDLMISPEGVWNKTPDKLLEYFWPGVYRLAKETNCKVIPIVHYIYDPTQRISKKENPIHTVIDDPIDITKMEEKEALEYYRNVLATWYYIMMEKYGNSTREKLLDGHDNIGEAYEEVLNALVSSVERYDSPFERNCAYRPKWITNPEDVFEPIANIEPTKENALHQQYAKKLVLTRKKEDYQRRF